MTYRVYSFFTLCLVVWVVATSNAPAQTTNSWGIVPKKATLRGPEASLQLLVTRTDEQGRTIDLGRVATYKSSRPSVATVHSEGHVVAQSDGKTTVQVTWRGQTQSIPVIVRGVRSPAPISFQQDVIPILSKAGCNAGGCHGKAEGQNGFKLSVFGSDPAADFARLVKESRGRRILFSSPKNSLFLRKATGQTAHGGGRKIEPGSLWYRRLHRWIAEGAEFDKGPKNVVQRVVIQPSTLTMRLASQQQLRVTAIDSSGRHRDVTTEAQFDSNFPQVAKVEGAGLVRVGKVPGAAAVLVRYMDQVAVCRVTVPRPGKSIRRPPENNFVDKLVWDQLERLNIQPSPIADDTTFLRRVYLDTIGTLPTVKEAREFLADKRKNKRKLLIDKLLDRPEYSQYWAMQWADLLRVDRNRIKANGVVAMTRWLKKQMAKNTPYDRFVRSILTARGNAVAESPTSFYIAHKKPELLARSVSQIFLGVRIECAQCHHHPFERWGQDDYFAFAGFFTGVKQKQNRVLVQPGRDLTNPRSKAVVPAAALGNPKADFADTHDRRQVLADWMTSPKNPYFARMLANRLWSHYFGRGLVEPVDDMRATNPPTNEPLLDALAKHLIDVKYDLKAFTRTLLNSRVYQLSTTANESNKFDTQNYSHAQWRAMPAEVLLDAICQTTGVPEKFNGWPKGYRAIEVWDSRVPSYFFRIFGKPQRTTVCSCERGTKPSIAQALHLMNAPEISEKIRHRDGRAAKLARSKALPDAIVEELYLSLLSRFPTQKEREFMKREAFANTDRRTAVEDVLWALLNTKEFVFNH